MSSERGKVPMPLKIFLGGKMILLADEKGVSSFPADWTIEYRSGERLRDVFKEFSAEPGVKSLAFWSQRNNFPELKREFLSLFGFVEAAGGIVENEKGELLFIFRRGKWDLPKGKISDSGKKKKKGSKQKETPAEAALREVREETGIRKLNLVRETSSTWHIYSIKKKILLKRTRWFEMKSDSGEKLIPETREDITKVEWISRKSLPKVLQNTYASLTELIAAYGR
ncbi:MAG TPA: NUDIX domain-containing protein [Bacteroidales bacterium]|nr:NUDIX domain-containing protein [Bacteroidales bacterium]